MIWLLLSAGVGGKSLIPWRAPPCACRGRRITFKSAVQVLERTAVPVEQQKLFWEGQ